jgi:hypothetical protein
MENMEILSCQKISPSHNGGVRAWFKYIAHYKKLDDYSSQLQGWPHLSIPNFVKMVGLNNWLQDNINVDDYVWVCSNIWFTNESDAVLFKLSWNNTMLQS